jgi:hypothetical protein
MDGHLLSLGTLYDLGYENSMKCKGGKIYKDGMVVASTTGDGRLVYMKTVQDAVHARAAVAMESVEVWHRRLGHLGENNVNKLEGMATGIEVDGNHTVGICCPAWRAITIGILQRNSVTGLV